MYRRALLKVSGESLGSSSDILCEEFLRRLASEIKEVRGMGAELAVLPGGGNILRGGERVLRGIERVRADFMGMLGTLINSLALLDALEKEGVEGRVFAPLSLPNMAEVYEIEKARRFLRQGVAIFAFGTGSPFFTTDTAAALRAIEIDAEVLLKATKVGGVYDRDPKKHNDARFIPYLFYDEVLERRLMVMDLTSITLCKENSLPIVVFDIKKEGNLTAAIRGQQVGTKIGGSNERRDLGRA